VRRVPQANIPVNDDEALRVGRRSSARDTTRNPEQVRSMLATYQQALRRGRQAIDDQPAGDDTTPTSTEGDR
jgi:hypothetical protein